MNDQHQDASKNVKRTLIKLERVKDRIGLSKTTIYAWVRRPPALSSGAV
jgi:predicted DNA-binding transcriptional regulator AlpA